MKDEKCVAMSIVLSQETLSKLRKRYNQIQAEYLSEEELEQVTAKELLQDLLLFLPPSKELEEIDIRDSIYKWEEY